MRSMSYRGAKLVLWPCSDTHVHPNISIQKLFAALDEVHLLGWPSSSLHMPLQKRHPGGQPPQNQLLYMPPQLQERRRTLRTIGRLSATEAPIPNSSSFIRGLQRQLLDQTCHSKAMPDVAKARNRRSLPPHIPNPQHPHVKVARTTPPAYPQYKHQSPIRLQ
jgi:hypothetical protein